MKKALLVGLFLLCLTANAAAEGNGRFIVEFEQNNVKITGQAGIVKLKKAPFAVNLTFDKPMGILIAASLDSSRYDLAKQGALVEKFILAGTGVAESLFNEGKDISVSKEGTNYWYFENEKEHRFDRVLLTKNQIIGHRTIENLFFVDEEKKSVPLQRSDVKKLFLVFVSAEYDWGTLKYKEFKRETIIVEFVD